jgi:hypothetical protein
MQLDCGWWDYALYVELQCRWLDWVYWVVAGYCLKRGCHQWYTVGGRLMLIY